MMRRISDNDSTTSRLAACSRPPKMNHVSLRYFVEVADCGSIRQAAQRLHVAPSAVSRQIANLEHDLQAELIERSPGGVTLTAAGALVAEQGRSMFRGFRSEDNV
jgi:molybdate transport repressor ModE-like protein